uniref:Uncharacterized protein n=1 Tax=Ciona savignyi TaxID=51511 RepID=H2ZBA8_CIOSA
MKIKCRKCRGFLMEYTCIINAHGGSLQDDLQEENACTDNNSQVWFVNYDIAPDWIHSAIDEGNWKMGKLNCSSCNGRIGSFNFVQQQKCSCESFVVPPVWLQKSKVDVGFKPKIAESKRSTQLETLTVINDVNQSETISPEIEANLFNFEITS